VARERSGDRDVAHLAVFGMDLDQGLHVAFVFERPERLDEPLGCSS
jgi:hypothetical protein